MKTVFILLSFTLFHSKLVSCQETRLHGIRILPGIVNTSTNHRLEMGEELYRIIAKKEILLREDGEIFWALLGKDEENKK